MEIRTQALGADEAVLHPQHRHAGVRSSGRAIAGVSRAAQKTTRPSRRAAAAMALSAREKKPVRPRGE